MEVVDDLGHICAELVLGEFLAWVQYQPALLATLDVVNEALGREHAQPAF